MATNTLGLTSLFWRILNLSCTTSIYMFWFISMSIPEIILYPITFQHIAKHNQTAAMSGMLNQVHTLRKMNHFWSCLGY
jgi:hypothetical protein